MEIERVEGDGRRDRALTYGAGDPLGGPAPRTAPRARGARANRPGATAGCATRSPRLPAAAWSGGQTHLSRGLYSSSARHTGGHGSERRVGLPLARGVVAGSVPVSRRGRGDPRSSGRDLGWPRASRACGQMPHLGPAERRGASASAAPDAAAPSLRGASPGTAVAATRFQPLVRKPSNHLRLVERPCRLVSVLASVRPGPAKIPSPR